MVSSSFCRNLHHRQLLYPRTGARHLTFKKVSTFQSFSSFRVFKNIFFLQTFIAAVSIFYCLSQGTWRLGQDAKKWRWKSFFLLFWLGFLCLKQYKQLTVLGANIVAIKLNFQQDLLGTVAAWGRGASSGYPLCSAIWPHHHLLLGLNLCTGALGRVSFLENVAYKELSIAFYFNG